jgi:hypothetical protein
MAVCFVVLGSFVAFASMARVESFGSENNEGAGYFFLISLFVKKKWLIVLCMRFVCPVIL